MKAIVQFTRLGQAKYLSHLDVLRAVQRWLRRSGLPIVYTSGFNPHPRLSFATASPVGLLSLYEVLESPVAEENGPAEALEALRRTAPPVMEPVRCVMAPDSAPSPMAAVEAARYEVRVRGDLSAPAASFMDGASCLVRKRSKSGEREVDIRPMVLAMACDARDGVSMLDMTLVHKGDGALRPELVLEGLSGTVQGTDGPRIPLSVTRTMLYKGNQPLMDFYAALK